MAYAPQKPFTYNYGDIVSALIVWTPETQKLAVRVQFLYMVLAFMGFCPVSHERTSLRGCLCKIRSLILLRKIDLPNKLGFRSPSLVNHQNQFKAKFRGRASALLNLI